MRRHCLLLLGGLCLLGGGVAQAGDGLIRWRDAQGHWHFSNHAEQNPALRPAPAPAARVLEGALADPGPAVLSSPQALLAWLMALKKEALGMTPAQERIFLSRVRWPQGPVAWEVRISEVINTDFLRPERGHYQVRARTVQGLRGGGLPVIFDSRGAKAGAWRRGQRLVLRGEARVDARVFRFMDDYGYLYNPLPIRMDKP